MRREKIEHDLMMDIANEARWDAAVESLREQHGDREFTDEEVEDEAEALDQAGLAHDDY